MFLLSVEATLLLEFSCFKGEVFSLVAWLDGTADFLRYPCLEFLPVVGCGGCCCYCLSLFSTIRLALWFLFVPVPVPPEESLWPAETLSLLLLMASCWDGSF
jgi:hypothetical protein